MTVHHPSTGYSVALEEQRSGIVSPSSYYYQPKNLEQESLQTIPKSESMREQEVSNVGHTDTHTPEHVVDPTAKSFEPVGTCREPPPLQLQASLL